MLEETLAKRKAMERFKGGVMLDVTSVEEARIAQEAGALGILVLSAVPSDVREAGGVERMADPALVKAVQEVVSIPVVSSVRIGHIAEAQILEAIGVDAIEESEVLTPVDETHHIDKNLFKTPFCCPVGDLSEALRRINEGTAMLRTKGEAGTGDIAKAVEQIRTIRDQFEKLKTMSQQELRAFSEQAGVPYALVTEVATLERLPTILYTAGGISTPADAALMMQLGADGVFVGSGVFKSSNPLAYARAIVRAVAHFREPEILAQVSKGLGAAMPGLDIRRLKPEEIFSTRGR
jgi:pyridoxal 5'-phosphate synthase pdxS subunit